MGSYRDRRIEQVWREEIVRVCRLLHQKGYVVATDGNVSVGTSCVLAVYRQAGGCAFLRSFFRLRAGRFTSYAWRLMVMLDSERLSVACQPLFDDRHRSSGMASTLLGWRIDS